MIDQTVTVRRASADELEDSLNRAGTLRRQGTLYERASAPVLRIFGRRRLGGDQGRRSNSTYYGKLKIVLGQKYVTPVRHHPSDSFPAKATGPSIDQIMIGSEGAYAYSRSYAEDFQIPARKPLRFLHVQGLGIGPKASREIMQENAQAVRNRISIRKTKWHEANGLTDA